LEKKHSEEQQANEEKQKKLDETEIKMRQFQDYLRRLMLSTSARQNRAMSKSILFSP
jgi:hypothetical protein